MSTKSASRLHPRRQVAQAALKTLVLPYLEILNCPRALTVWLLFEAGEHSQLVDLTVDPLKYDSVESFKNDFLATELLKKSDLLDTGIDTTSVALGKARTAEARCATTNVRFQTHFYETPSGLTWPEFPRLPAILLAAREKVARVLGESPPDWLPSFIGWSPGRTTRSYGASISAVEKFQVKPDVTTTACWLAVKMLNQSPRWAQAAIDADGPCSLLGRNPKVLEFAVGNYALVVPKDAKTGRFICYEPHLNIAMQRSVGDFIRRRLQKRCGVDLDDQSINQELAMKGSSQGNLGTIDLVSASDTLAVSLVQFLLPEGWFHLLNQLRCRSTMWPDSKNWEVMNKFSSMGNGFTFELQSLLFYALCWATYKEVGIVPRTRGPLRNLSVYGDDIVVDSRVYFSTKAVLEFAGFEVNHRKSYSTGLFRESCGTNAFAGFDVSPPRIRPGQRGLSLAVSFHNRIRAHCRKYHGDLPLSYCKLLQWIRLQFPGPLGPEGYGDGHYHVNFDEATPQRASRGWEGWYFRTRKPFSRSRLSEFLDSEEKFSFHRRFEVACYLAATAPRKPFELARVLAEGGSYTKSTLRVLATEWPDLLV